MGLGFRVWVRVAEQIPEQGFGSGFRPERVPKRVPEWWLWNRFRSGLRSCFWSGSGTRSGRSFGKSILPGRQRERQRLRTKRRKPVPWAPWNRVAQTISMRFGRSLIAQGLSTTPRRRNRSGSCLKSYCYTSDRLLFRTPDVFGPQLSCQVRPVRYSWPEL